MPPGTGTDYINITGGQAVPMMIHLNFNGDPTIKYMKCRDNCTQIDSLIWNNDCPATKKWAHEIYLGF